MPDILRAHHGRYQHPNYMYLLPRTLRLNCMGYCAHAEAAALAQSNGLAQSFASAAASDPTVQSCLGSSSNAVAKAIATANSSGGNANANAAAAVGHGFSFCLPACALSIIQYIVLSGVFVSGPTPTVQWTRNNG